jgi:hypothetical protein
VQKLVWAGPKALALFPVGRLCGSPDAGPKGFGYNPGRLSSPDAGPKGFGYNPGRLSCPGAGPKGFGYNPGRLSSPGAGPKGFGYNPGRVSCPNAGPKGFGYNPGRLSAGLVTCGSTASEVLLSVCEVPETRDAASKYESKQKLLMLLFVGC